MPAATMENHVAETSTCLPFPQLSEYSAYAQSLGAVPVAVMKPAYIFGANNALRLRVASTLPERQRTWRMVYDLYLAKGYAEPRPDQMWFGPFDALPGTRTYYVTDQDVDVATITTVCDSALALPADNLFEDQLGPLREQGAVLAEIISLASQETHRRNALDALKHLFKVGMLAARHRQRVTDLVMTVNPHHVAFYEKMLHFTRLGPVRSYAKVNGAPAVLMRVNIAQAEPHFRDRYGTQPGSVWHHFFAPESVHQALALVDAATATDEALLIQAFVSHMTSQTITTTTTLEQVG